MLFRSLKAANKNISELLKSDRVWQALKIKNGLFGLRFNINPTIEKAAVEGIIQSFFDDIDRHEEAILIAENFLSQKTILENKEIKKTVLEYVDNLFSKNAPDQMFSGFGKTPIERIDGINKSFWPLFDTKFKSNILGLYEHCLKKLSKEQRQFGINSYQEQERYVQKWEERLNQVKSLNNEFFTTESILNIAKNQDNQFPIRQKAFDILTVLIENGGASISEEFGSIIQKRGEQKEISESK